MRRGTTRGARSPAAVRWPCRFLVRAALGLAVGLAGCGGGGGGQISGIQLTPAPRVGAVSLPTAASPSAPFRFRASAGHLLLVYFGYTSCPDVCPTTLSDLRTALGPHGLGGLGRRVDVAMVTIDPKRDTTRVISNYLHTFFPHGTALRTGDDRLLRRAAEAFGADYAVTYGRRPQDEKVSHTAFVYAVDSRGAVAVQWSFGTRPPEYASDLRILLRRAAGS